MKSIHMILDRLKPIDSIDLSATFLELTFSERVISSSFFVLGVTITSLFCEWFIGLPFDEPAAT